MMIPVNLLLQTKNTFENSPDCVYIKDENLEYRYMNPAGCNVLQLHDEELISKLDKELYFSQYAQCLNAHDSAAMNNDVFYQLVDFLSKSGEELFVLDKKFPLKDEFGKTHGVLGFSRFLNYEELLFTLSLNGKLNFNTVKVTIDIKTLLNRHINLSEREINVLYCFLNGKSSKMIAEALGITERTVTFHLCNIKEKWSCNSREDIYNKAEEKGLIKFSALWSMLSDRNM